jgi:hypothetical protein
MKINSITLFIASLILTLTLVAWQNQPAATAEPRTITVTGDADVRVVPDEVILTLGVETWHEDLAIAKAQNDERVKVVITLAQNAGVEARYIQTDWINIQPRYEDNYEKERLIGYFVRKTIVITLKDIAKFDQLLTQALEAQVNYVQGIEFRTSQLRQYKDQARALAINAAREKATALAGELGQTIGQPQAIQEQHSNWWSSYGSWWNSWGNVMAQNVVQEVNAAPSTVAEALAPGQITVNAQVSVTFELE